MRKKLNQSKALMMVPDKTEKTWFGTQKYWHKNLCQSMSWVFWYFTGWRKTFMAIDKKDHFVVILWIAEPHVTNMYLFHFVSWIKHYGILWMEIQRIPKVIPWLLDSELVFHMFLDLKSLIYPVLEYTWDKLLLCFYFHVAVFCTYCTVCSLLCGSIRAEGVKIYLLA